MIIIVPGIGLGTLIFGFLFYLLCAAIGDKTARRRDARRKDKEIHKRGRKTEYENYKKWGL
jgi:hypothetical protein